MKQITSSIKEKINSSPLLKNNLAYILIFLSQFGWPLSWIYYNQHNVNFLESSFGRGIVFIIINYVICRIWGYDLDFKDPYTFKLQCLRSSIMIVHTSIVGFSQFVLPIPIVHTINVSGIIFTFIIDYILNGVKINKNQLIGIIIALTGVFLTVNNIYLYKLINPNFQYETSFQNYLTDDPKLKNLCAFALFLDNLIWGYAIVLTKKLKGISTFQVNFIFGLANLWCSSLFLKYVASQTSITVLLLSMVYSALPMLLSAWLFIAALILAQNSGTMTMFCLIPIAIAQLISFFKYNESQNPIIFIGIIGLCIGMYKTIFNKE